MLSWSGEPFVCCPLYLLFSCVFLIFLWDDCSLGYQCWPHIVGIWALRANKQDENIALFFFSSCRSTGNTTGRVSGRQRLQVIPLHRAAWFCPAAPFPSRCRSGRSLYFHGPLPCQRSTDGRWGLGLVSLPSCPGDSTRYLQLLQPDVFLLSSSTSWGITCTASLMLSCQPESQVTADTTNAWEL